ncbi:ABC transporter substrate-binding protein [Dactylosporangium sp. NPDC000521]|uniref:ABC transporter substrate-binding protein n=1 Tax=Dactylosporangium sp. NPDC000521 TaxID=3363975 RepID=UPI00369A5A14
MFRRLVVAVASATLLAACSSTGSTGDGAASGAPVRGGTVVFATDVEPTCLDPAAPSQIATQILQRNVYDSLIQQDAKGAFHPWLASSWDVSADGTTYTFHLRDGVTFHDGTKFDATAAKATFDHFTDPATKAPLAGSLPFASATATDPSTLVVKLKSPFAPFLQLVSFSVLGIQSPAALAKGQAALCAGGPGAAVGTGPFTTAAYSKGQSLTFARYDAYNWPPEGSPHQGAAYLDKVEVRFLPENAIRVGAVSSGQAQLAANVPPVTAAAFEAGGGVRVLSAAAAGTPFTAYLNTKRAPFDDVKVRQAFQRGIDIENIVKSVYAGRFPRAWSPLTPSTPNSYDSTLENSWPQDLTLAGRLLDEAGWNQKDGQGYRVKDGKRLSIVWVQNSTVMREQRDVVAQAVADNAKKLGFEVTVQGLDAGTFSARAKAGDYDVTDQSNQRADPDMLYNVWSSKFAATSGGANYANVTDPQVDQWLSQGSTALRQEDRPAAYKPLQKWVVDNAAAVPIYVPQYLLGASNAVQGVQFTVSGYPDSFYTVWRTK